MNMNEEHSSKKNLLANSSVGNSPTHSTGVPTNDMTRSHLPTPQTSSPAAVFVDVENVSGTEAKVFDASTYQAPPKPSDARCRLCDSTEDQDLLIKPCRCDGDKKYVHRDCLDQQRAFNENNQGFMHCRDCEYRYWVDVVESYKTDKRCCGQPQRIWKFRGLVARDTIAIFIILQSIIACFAFVVERADSCASEQGCGQGCGDVKPWGYVCGTGVYDPVTKQNVTYGGVLLNDFSIMKLNQHYKTTYYFIGLLFFLATVGCVGFLHSCCWFCDGDHKGQGVDDYTNSCVDDYTCMYCFYADRSCCCYGSPYHHTRYRPIGGGRTVYYGNTNCDCCQGCNCGDCDCGKCDSDCKCSGGGGGGGEGAAILAFIALVLFIILVLLGFIYGCKFFH